MNQSRPRKLCREGPGGWTIMVPAYGTGSPPPLLASLRCVSIGSVGCLDARTNSLLLQILLAILQWLQAAGGAKHHDRRILLVFRRRRHLLLGQLERDAVALIGNAPEMKRVPVDHDFPAADAEKTAEINDGRAHRSGAIDDHIDDTPHVLVGRAANLAAEHAMSIPGTDDGDRGRRRRLLRCRGRIWHGRGGRILLFRRLRRGWLRLGRGSVLFRPRSPKPA